MQSSKHTLYSCILYIPGSIVFQLSKVFLYHDASSSFLLQNTAELVTGDYRIFQVLCNVLYNLRDHVSVLFITYMLVLIFFVKA